MRTYYRGPDAIVTSEVFLRHGPPTERFVIRDLRSVGIAMGEPKGVRLITVALPAAAAAMVAAVIVSVAGAVLAGVVILVSAVGAGLACAVAQQHRPRRWELRALYRNRFVVVFESADQRVFHQVSRALRRAIEDARPPLDEPLAA
jgi:ABC-type phosphate transport system permease subunit